MSSHWAEESFKIVTEEVYSGLNSESNFVNGQFQPSKDYLDKSRVVAERQIVRAGYRLAQVLDDIWSSH